MENPTQYKSVGSGQFKLAYQISRPTEASLEARSVAGAASDAAASQEASPVASMAAPLVLIHGFAEDGRIWERQLAFLKDHYPVIIPDLPGSGHSSPITGPVSIDEMADLIKAMLDQEGIDKCIMIGHSMGGYITLAFAERFRERLLSIGLFHSTAYADSEERIAGRNRKIAFIERNGSEPFLRQAIPDLFGRLAKLESGKLITSLVDRYCEISPLTLTTFQRSMIERPDRTAVLRGFDGPVLMILGKEDSAVPFEQSLQQTYLANCTVVHIFRDAGHMGMYEETDRSNQYLVEFIAFTEKTNQAENKI